MRKKKGTARDLAVPFLLICGDEDAFISDTFESGNSSYNFNFRLVIFYVLKTARCGLIRRRWMYVWMPNWKDVIQASLTILAYRYDRKVCVWMKNKSELGDRT